MIGDCSSAALQNRKQAVVFPGKGGTGGYKRLSLQKDMIQEASSIDIQNTIQSS